MHAACILSNEKGGFHCLKFLGFRTLLGGTRVVNPWWQLPLHRARMRAAGLLCRTVFLRSHSFAIPACLPLRYVGHLSVVRVLEHAVNTLPGVMPIFRWLPVD